MNELEKVLKACSDKNRIRILKLLQRRKLCVCEIAFVLGITQPSVSRHLKKLKDAGLVQAEQYSFWTNYFLEAGNIYAVQILSSMRRWLQNDKAIKEDLKKLKRAKRNELCCKTG
ncbi:MAG: metalloregulator ArsR/SmtB family transcription factor [Candidatus Omnitrophica bacterium]|nr:metalloregulator ArsR/SmtB family transcription factor [Candidatus Omnitrophota bacterium]MBD3269073.1 metalloregulator ArsR/SmtB family transcription factor [Candidatus Omnitrophota bacterium]